MTLEQTLSTSVDRVLSHRQILSLAHFTVMRHGQGLSGVCAACLNAQFIQPLWAQRAQGVALRLLYADIG